MQYRARKFPLCTDLGEQPGVVSRIVGIDLVLIRCESRKTFAGMDDDALLSATSKDRADSSAQTLRVFKD
jgi:hypothetical protein